MADDFKYIISQLDDVLNFEKNYSGSKDAKNSLLEAIELHNDFLR